MTGTGRNRHADANDAVDPREHPRPRTGQAAETEHGPAAPGDNPRASPSHESADKLGLRTARTCAGKRCGRVRRTKSVAERRHARTARGSDGCETRQAIASAQNRVADTKSTTRLERNSTQKRREPERPKAPGAAATAEPQRRWTPTPRQLGCRHRRADTSHERRSRAANRSGRTRKRSTSRVGGQPDEEAPVGATDVAPNSSVKKRQGRTRQGRENAAVNGGSATGQGEGGAQPGPDSTTRGTPTVCRSSGGNTLAGTD